MEKVSDFQIVTVEPQHASEQVVGKGSGWEAGISPPPSPTPLNQGGLSFIYFIHFFIHSLSASMTRWASLVVQVVKNLQEAQVQSLSLEDSI